MKRYRRDMVLIILLSWLVMMCGCMALDKIADTAIDAAEKGKEVAKALGVAGWLTTILGAAGFGFQTYKKWRKSKQLASLINGLDEIKGAVIGWIANFKAEKKRWPTFDEVKDFVDNILKTHAKAKGVKNEMDKDVHKFREILKG